MKTQYILVTPVHNEEKYIEQVIKCVISQTILPQKWVIVDDASEDKTSEIIEEYKNKYDFIDLYKLNREKINSYYSRRTEVFLLGYERIKHIEHDFLSALDSDLTILPDYYENILKELDHNPRLGITSGTYINMVNGHLEKVVRDSTSTPGGLQMFRRECYEAIGGYRLMKYGGDDSLADILARMKGWETRSFPQYQAIHHRPTGTAGGKRILIVRFHQGVAEYNLATHPLFMAAKSIRRAFIEKPYIIGSAARYLGYISGSLKKGKREIPDDVARFSRQEQIKKLLTYPFKLKQNASISQQLKYQK